MPDVLNAAWYASLAAESVVLWRLFDLRFPAFYFAMPSHARCICLLLAAVSLRLAFGQGVTSPIRTGVELVVVDVQVIDSASGHSIGDLKRNDFEILDNGKRQEIRQFDYGVSPLDVVLALDVSGSMIQSTRQVAAGATSALDALYRDDRMAVLAFSSRAHVVQPWTSDPTALAEAVHEAVDRITRVDAGTRLFDSVLAATSLFRQSRDPLRRRAILVISDDRDESSKISTQDLQRSILESNAILDLVITTPLEPYGSQRTARIGLPIPGLPPITRDTRTRNRKAYRSLKELVQDSGGECLQPNAPREALLGIFDRLRGRYTLAYSPAEDARGPGFHAISVRIAGVAAGKHTVVRARSGYWRAP